MRIIIRLVSLENKTMNKEFGLVLSKIKSANIYAKNQISIRRVVVFIILKLRNMYLIVTGVVIRNKYGFKKHRP